ncbi:mechanosensitive ion channel family protein [Klebsiella pneumoniae]|nr:mechanosensitive ion channel domain-containing protein [Klebsiella pneumoniae]MCQ8361430.1 mechanosensitive ion channel family protein [Klebsiella pneumoniae]UMI01544.1 mechanosensitive ion channel [Klebsiella pneumoniae]
MNRMSIVILWALALLVLQPALAAEPRQQPTAREQARTVTIFHQPVVMLQATFGQTTPEERVLRTRSALRAFTEDDIRQPLRVVPVIRYGQPGRLFLMNGKPVLLLSQADLDEGDDLTLDQAAQRVLARMEAQRTSLQEQFNNRYLFISAGKALAGALLLALFYYGAFRAWRRVRRFFLLRILEKRSAIPQHWRRYLGNIEVRLYAVLVILLGMLACYLWLSWAFSLFPWTRVWSESLGDWSLGVIRDLSLSIVASLPGLMIVVLIFLLTWLIIRLVKVVLDQVAAGRIQVPGIHPETVSATRRLISVVIWLFALSAAYPFLPGANSLAFKGISVFFGLMLTLGSTGVMTHAMSGLVLIYSRALRKGDWIRLADNEGQVSEIGVLATKILTRENYIVTVPNAVVVSGKIINLSAESADGGVNLTTSVTIGYLTTSVTIGYDTPWRQVHALLELAARRTPGIDQQIAPVVRKLGLLDWYTSYELQVRLLPTTKLPDGRNALHSSIIDVFNEFGVQIMSPNFVMQPKAAVVVPQEAWYAAPAVAPQKPEK